MEFFAFDGPIRPAPPAGRKPILGAGATEYAKWDAQMAETIDVSSDRLPPNRSAVRLYDMQGAAMEGVFYRMTVRDEVETGYSEDGWVVIETEGVRPDTVHLEWDRLSTGAYNYKLNVELGCNLADEKTRTLHRLHNLGYTRSQGLEGATREFQRMHGLLDEGLGPDGLPPPETTQRLEIVYAESIKGSPRITRPEG